LAAIGSRGGWVNQERRGASLEMQGFLIAASQRNVWGNPALRLVSGYPRPIMLVKACPARIRSGGQISSRQELSVIKVLGSGHDQIDYPPMKPLAGKLISIQVHQGWEWHAGNIYI
jgi:hypothetical protein